MNTGSLCWKTAILICWHTGTLFSQSTIPYTAPAGFTVEIFAEGLELPTTLAFAPDSSHRLFVNELQSGRIIIFQNGRRLESPFARVQTNASGGFPVSGENGLLGLAFDPHFADNRFVYATYAVRTDTGTFGRVVRFTDNNNQGRDFTILLDGIYSAPGHQIESLAFGPDGKLYVSTGDAYLDLAAQNPFTWHGKILRLNPDGGVPEDNPFPGSYVFARGFRNCFDLVFRENGDLLTTENGPDRDDEFNVVQKGGNYGWPLYLGAVKRPGFIDPIHVWQQIVSPAGMVFYRGTAFPQKYRGALFQVLFGHTYSSGPNAGTKRVQAVTLTGEGQATQTAFEDFVVFTGAGLGNPLDIAEGPEGALYFTDIFQGKIYRIRYTGSTAVAEAASGSAPRFFLSQNSPNPFNPRTTIRFSLSQAAFIELSIYTIEGRLVRRLISGYRPAGQGAAVWEGDDQHQRAVGSGIYLVRLQAGALSQTIRVALIR